MRRVKFGIRKPSYKKRVAAWKSGLPGGKRFWRHRVGIKMPRNTGWVTNPDKFIYNKVYRRTTMSLVPRGIGFMRFRKNGAAGKTVGTLLLFAVVLVLVTMAIKLVLAIAALLFVGLVLILLIASIVPSSRQPILSARNAVMHMLKNDADESATSAMNDTKL